MASPLLLEGRTDSPQPDDRDALIEGLRSTNRKLDEALRLERNRVASVEAGVRELRHILNPLYRALQKVYDEFDGMALGDTPAASTASRSSAAAWEPWKRKFPGVGERFIDALLTHGELTAAQLVVTAQCPRKQTIYDTASKFLRLGLIDKRGDKYVLKELP